MKLRRDKETTKSEKQEKKLRAVHQKKIDRWVKSGILEITGTNEAGETLYAPTERGRAFFLKEARRAGLDPSALALPQDGANGDEQEEQAPCVGE